MTGLVRSPYSLRLWKAGRRNSLLGLVRVSIRSRRWLQHIVWLLCSVLLSRELLLWGGSGLKHGHCCMTRLNDWILNQAPKRERKKQKREPPNIYMLLPARTLCGNLSALIVNKQKRKKSLNMPSSCFLFPTVHRYEIGNCFTRRNLGWLAKVFVFVYLITDTLLLDGLMNDRPLMEWESSANIRDWELNGLSEHDLEDILDRR